MTDTGNKDYWKFWYLALLAFLIGQILFYYWVSLYFQRPTI
jgi:uncharacterized protein YpmS